MVKRGLRVNNRIHVLSWKQSIPASWMFTIKHLPTYYEPEHTIFALSCTRMKAICCDL